MATSNRIGIKVDVEFPTATELQNELASKWATVKKNFDGKINVSADGNSLRSLRTQIQTALSQDLFEIKINAKDAIEQAEKLQKHLKEIDEELKGTRKLRVSLDVVNLNSSLKDLMGSMEKMKNQSTNALGQGMKGFTDKLNEADKKMNSISKKYKLNRDGNVTTVTEGQTKKDILGASEKVRFKEDAKGMTAEVEYLHSKEKALQNIKASMKDMYDVEKKMSKAQGDGDVEKFGRLQKEYLEMQKEARNLNDAYKERYGESAHAEEDIERLKRKQQLERDIATIAKDQKAEEEKQLQIAKEEEERLKKINAEMKQYESTLTGALTEYISLESKRSQLNKQIATATGETKELLEKQLGDIIKKQYAIEKEHDLQNMITEEQKKRLLNSKEETDLANKIVQAKIRDTKESEKQKELADKLTDAVKEYLSLEKQRSQVADKIKTATDETKVALEKQLASIVKKQQAIEEEHKIQESITDEQRRQLSNMQEEAQLVSEIVDAKIRDRQEVEKKKELTKQVTDALGQYLSLEKQIHTLTNQIKTATGETKVALEQQLDSVIRKQQAIQQEYNLQTLLTAEQRKLIEDVRHEAELVERIVLAKIRDRQEMERQKMLQTALRVALVEYIALERKRVQISKQVAVATDETRLALQEQLNEIVRMQEKLEKEHDLQKMISAEQREQLDNVKKESEFVDMVVQARIRDKQQMELISREIKEQIAQEREMESAVRDLISLESKRHALKVKIRDAEGEVKEALKAQLRYHTEIQENLMRENNLLRDMTKEQREMLSDVRKQHTLQDQLTDAMKAQVAEAKRLSDIAKEHKELEREIQSVVSRISQLEQKRFEIKRKLQSASDQEKQALKEQYQYYGKIIQKLNQQHDLHEMMTLEQKEALRNQKELNKIVLKTSEAKQRDLQNSQRQNVLAQKLQSELREVLEIEKKIAMLKELGHRDGNENQLRILRQSLQYAKEQYDTTLRTATANNKVTTELQEQMDDMKRIGALQEERIRDEAKLVAEQDKANAKYKELTTLLARAGQLQRDLIFAGSREESIISNALRETQRKVQEMREEVMQSELITAERKREIQLIERAQTEQKQLNQLRREAREMDRQYNTVNGVADFYSVYSNYNQGFQAVLREVKEIDEAFMRVKKVAEATDEVMQQFKENSYDTASQYGVTAVEYMTAVEKWVTAGYTLKKSEELAKTSTVGSFVGNVDAGDMSKWLSVPLNAYEKDLLSANDIINVMNETSNNHAVEMEELGKAYMRSASSVTSVGVTFEELTGFITAAQEATRIGGERIGTSLKAISSNYGSIKGQITVPQQNKHNWFEDVLGISIDETETMTDLFAELASQWNGLSDTEKNTSTFYLAGKEHQNIITAIMNEWDTYQKAFTGAEFEIGLGENGSAYKEFNKQKDSVRFMLAEVKNAWSELMNTIGESDGAVKKILGAVVNGLQGVTDLVQNESLMDMLKMILLGVGFHAGSNGMIRALDLMSTGLSNIHKNAQLTTGSLRTLFRRNGSANGNGAGGNGAGGNGGNNNPDGGNGQNNNSGQNHLMGRASSLTNVLKGALGFLPLIGDALLIIELMGGDVFGTLAKAIDKAFESPDEHLDNIKKKQKEIRDESMLLNGDMDKLEFDLNNEETGYIAVMEKTRKEDKNANLDRETFENMKDAFNVRVEELGFEEDIKITWNNYDEIMEKLELYKKKLEELKVEEAKKLAKESLEQYDEMDEGTDVAEKEMEDLQAKKKLLEETKEKQEEMAESMRKQGMGYNANQQQENADETAKKIEAVEKEIAELDKTYKKFDDTYKNVGENLLLLGEDAGEALSNIDDKDQLAKTLYGMKVAAEDAKEGLNTVKQAQAGLKDETKLTEQSFYDLVGSVEGLDEMYSYVTYEDYINNVDGVKDAIDKTIQAHVENAEQTVATADEALAQGEKVRADAKLSSEDIYALGTDVQTLSEKVKEVPDSWTTTFKANITEGFSKAWGVVKDAGGGVIDFVTGKTWNKRKEGLKDDSISTAPTTKGLVSASVSTTGEQGGALVSNATSTNYNTSAKARADATAKAYDKVNQQQSQQQATDTNATVSQDIWRYWRTEDKLNKLTNAMADLERSVTLAGEDYKKVGEIYSKQLQNLKQQDSTLQTLKGAKTHEAQQRLVQLQAYGFKVDKKMLSISNLESQSMSLKGDKAKGAEEILNQWHSLVSEIGTIDQQIKDISTSVQTINDSIKANNIAKEKKVYENFLKSVEEVIKTVDNRKALNDTFMSHIQDGDFELSLKMTEKLANDSAKAIESLAYKFNKLSASNIVNEENGTEFLGVLEDLRDRILENADAVITYNQSLNDMEISRTASDLGEMANALDTLSTKMEDARSGVQGGLLSGTKLTDLQSTQLSKLDLGRKNQLDKMAQERVDLEQKLQVALDGFAKKNVDRTAKVATETLRINNEMYQQLLTMSEQFNTGKGVSNYTTILSDLSKITTEKVKDENYKFDKELEKLYNELYDKQLALNKGYSDRLASSNYEERLKAEYQYSVESLALQKSLLEKSIKTSQMAIKEYSEQLKDDSLTTAQITTLKDAIKTEEDAIIDSQNAIKDAVTDIYEYKFSRIDELMSKYDEMTSALEYSLSLVEAVRPNDTNALFKLREASKDNYRLRKQALNDIIASLEYELSLQETGSYEWRIVNAELSDYNKQLQDANSTLIQMNKEMTQLRLDGMMNKFEKQLFNGKTLTQFKEVQELWLTGLEREIALEEMYDRIAEIGTNAFNEKMAVLDKQDKVSRLEMDYLAKQLDILEMQKALEEGKEQRTVKTLQRNADGTFDWNYVADETEASEALKNIKQAQLELLQMEDQAKESYLGKLEGIVAGIQNGDYENRQQLKDSLEELKGAYKLILGDMPATMSKLSAEILYAYEQYEIGNAEILNEMSKSSNATPTVATIDKLRVDVVSEIQKLGDKLKTAIEDSLSNSVGSINRGVYSSNNVSTAQQSSSSVTISKVEFPNVTSSDEIKDAILNLPQYALQYSKRK